MSAGSEWPPTIDATAQGPQLVIPGAERSARQAAQAREQRGRGKIPPRVAQKPADHGLFAEPKGDALPFDEPPQRGSTPCRET